MSTLEQVTGQARRELAKVIVGQAEMVDLLLLTIVCGGHALLEGRARPRQDAGRPHARAHPAPASSSACSARPT